jgi:hypothetical protein
MVAAMILAILALAMIHDVCPITIGVGRDGQLFSDRFQGWYRVTLKTLQSDLHGGCYNDANPSPVTSIKIVVAPGSPELEMDEVLVILKKEGWSRDRVNVRSWDEYPGKPK